MITLYSTGCPKCRVLESKLKELNIEYETIKDKEVLIKKGFKSAPQLEVDGLTMDFSTAIKWTKNYTKE